MKNQTWSDSILATAIAQVSRRLSRLAQRIGTGAAIAALVGIAEGTVDKHILSARRKLGGMGRWDAADALRIHEADAQSLGRQPLGMVDRACSGDLGCDPDASGDAVRDVRCGFGIEPSTNAAPERPPRIERLYDLNSQFTPMQSVVAIAKLTALLLVVVSLAFAVGTGMQGIAEFFRPVGK